MWNCRLLVIAYYIQSTGIVVPQAQERYTCHLSPTSSYSVEPSEACFSNEEPLVTPLVLTRFKKAFESSSHEH